MAGPSCWCCGGGERAFRSPPAEEKSRFGALPASHGAVIIHSA
jgi:hypothetical protein